jgi:hypothetical protein
VAWGGDGVGAPTPDCEEPEVVEPELVRECRLGEPDGVDRWPEGPVGDVPPDVPVPPELADPVEPVWVAAPMP